MQEGQQPAEGQWDFAPADTPTSAVQPVAWTGSEFIAQHKSGGWYGGLIVALVAVCAIIFVLSKDIVSVVFVAIMGALFAVIANHKPKQRAYMIDEHGISIDQRHYQFNDFKSFALQHEGAIGYISLLPLQRMRPELTIYFAPGDEQRIFDVLSNYLPHEERKDTIADKFARNIRF